MQNGDDEKCWDPFGWVLFRYSLFKNCNVCSKMYVNSRNIELNDICWDRKVAFDDWFDSAEISGYYWCIIVKVAYLKLIRKLVARSTSIAQRSKLPELIFFISFTHVQCAGLFYAFPIHDVTYYTHFKLKEIKRESRFINEAVRDADR